MNRIRYLILSTLLGGITLSGCTKYIFKPKPPALPPYIQKIAVRPFSNHSQQYGLEDKLTLAVQTEFGRDGRYQISTEDQADGVLFGDISRYVMEPLSYDVNHIPTQYKLWILVDVTFYDKVKNQPLWREPGMTGELRFFVASSGLAGSLSEVEAQQTIWDQMSRDIATRTFEGFGTVTGNLDQSGAKSNSDLDRSPSAAQKNNPPLLPSEEPPAPSPTPLPY